MVQPFYADPGFVNALAGQLQRTLPADIEHVLFSYHGLPERQLRVEDGTGYCFSSAACCDTMGNPHCYRAQCYATTRALAAKLPVPHTTTFQSRLGRTPWVKPYTDVVLEELAAKGIKRIAVTSPGFVADCLETVEELGKRAVTQFTSLGGESLTVVPCLNGDPSFIDVLERLVKRPAEEST
jgi:ferrochelatase